MRESALTGQRSSSVLAKVKGKDCLAFHFNIIFRKLDEHLIRIEPDNNGLIPRSRMFMLHCFVYGVINTCMMNVYLVYSSKSVISVLILSLIKVGSTID